MEPAAGTIKLTLDTPGIYHVDQLSQESADKISDLCNKNHTEHHILTNEYNDIFLHNHIVHHLLTLYSLGDTPQHAEEMYDANQYYLQKQPATDAAIYANLVDKTKYMAALGDHFQYTNFLKFFESEIAAYGMEVTVNRFVFGDDEIGDDMIMRLFQGFLHPIIHLGFGLEFKQPAVIAEALAQAAIHNETHITQALVAAEKLARSRKDHHTMVSILNDVNQNPNIINGRGRETFEKLRDGLLTNAEDEAVDAASRWIVLPNDEDITLKAAELMNASVYAVASLQRQDKHPRFDFLLLHIPNSAIFMSVVVKLPWISNIHKARLLSLFGQLMVLLFAAYGSGIPLDMGVIRKLKPIDGGFPGALKRGIAHADDGHAVKLVRAVAFGAVVSKPYESREEFLVKQDDFLKIERAIVESLNPSGGKAGLDVAESWIRTAGMESSWDDVPAPNEEPAWKLRTLGSSVRVANWVNNMP